MSYFQLIKFGSIEGKQMFSLDSTQVTSSGAFERQQINIYDQKHTVQARHIQTGQLRPEALLFILEKNYIQRPYHNIP